VIVILAMTVGTLMVLTVAWLAIVIALPVMDQQLVTA